MERIPNFKMHLVTLQTKSTDVTQNMVSASGQVRAAVKKQHMNARSSSCSRW